MWFGWPLLLSVVSLVAAQVDSAAAVVNGIIGGATVGSLFVVASVVVCVVCSRAPACAPSDSKQTSEGVIKTAFFVFTAAPRSFFGLESHFLRRVGFMARFRVGIVLFMRAILRMALVLVGALNLRADASGAVDDTGLLPLLAVAALLLPWRRIVLRWWLMLLLDALINVLLVLFSVACADCVSGERFHGIISLALFAVDLLLALACARSRVSPVEPMPSRADKVMWHVTLAVTTGVSVFLAVAGSRKPLALLAIGLSVIDMLATTGAFHRYCARTQNLIIMMLVSVLIAVGLMVALFVAPPTSSAAPPEAVLPAIVGLLVALMHGTTAACGFLPMPEKAAPPLAVVHAPPPRATKSVPAAAAPAPPAPSSGKAGDVEIDAAELENLVEIGSGAFGLVYRAEHRFALVAVKCVNDNAFGDETDLEKEARTLQQLPTHANVVAFRGLCRLNRRRALVLEFCEGGSLLDALRNAAIKWTPASEQRVASGTAAGVAHLHKCGIVHRDLAARNVLLASLQTMVPKVTDFGMSRSDADSNTKSSLGAAGWMAPEQMARQGQQAHRYEFSPASDVFSFGVVLFEIVEKKTPWQGHAPIDIRDQVGKGQRLQTNEALYTPELAKLRDACWSYLPAQRPTMEVVAGKLRDLVTTDSQRVRDEGHKAAAPASYDDEAPQIAKKSASAASSGHLYDSEAPQINTKKAAAAVIDIYDDEAPRINNVYDDAAPVFKQ